jgi:Glutamine synthetase
MEGNPYFRKQCGLSAQQDYIGGILKHAKPLKGFANSRRKSYKRLIVGFEAPVLVDYSVRNRCGFCRIGINLSKKGVRCEIRFLDAGGNLYLSFGAMLMAGIDGIKNKIHPGECFDKELYELPAEEVKAILIVCGFLREVMESLDKEREFLNQGGVFSDDEIDVYIVLKFEEIYKFEDVFYIVEFEMYYSS